MTELTEQLASCLLATNEKMCTAESCTGGLIAASCTDLAGSSLWFDRGFITYSNEAKQEMLGVAHQLIKTHGAVSQAVALAMAQGALARANAQWAVAVTGVAGPGGGTNSKPVGTVWIAWANAEHSWAQGFLFEGDRQQVRTQTVAQALGGLVHALKR